MNTDLFFLFSFSFPLLLDRVSHHINITIYQARTQTCLNLNPQCLSLEEFADNPIGTGTGMGMCPLFLIIGSAPLRTGAGGYRSPANWSRQPSEISSPEAFWHGATRYESRCTFNILNADRKFRGSTLRPHLKPCLAPDLIQPSSWLRWSGNNNAGMKLMILTSLIGYLGLFDLGFCQVLLRVESHSTNHECLSDDL